MIYYNRAQYFWSYNKSNRHNRKRYTNLIFWYHNNTCYIKKPNTVGKKKKIRWLNHIIDIRTNYKIFQSSIDYGLSSLCDCICCLIFYFKYRFKYRRSTNLPKILQWVWNKNGDGRFCLDKFVFNFTFFFYNCTFYFQNELIRIIIFKWRSCDDILSSRRLINANRIILNFLQNVRMLL